MKTLRGLRFGLIVSLWACAGSGLARDAEVGHAQAGHAQVVLLGTGTPQPDPARSGPSTAIVVNSTPYLVDAGVGVIRRAAAARARGIESLRPVNLRIVFITHLHSDHTLGLPDLMMTPWVMGRREALEIYGPHGTQEMISHLLQAYEIDRTTRIKGLEHSNDSGWKVNVHEITSGVVYKDANVTVTAFGVRHGNMNAFGYRFETPDRTVVISGDTSPTPAIAANCAGCDVLISEAYTAASFKLIPQAWQRYRLAFHTSVEELGKIAREAKPGLLILVHRGNAGCDQADTAECRDAGNEEHLLAEMRRAYTGRIVIGRDLDIY
jgi:ribonuclease BN (tRNA processing enzyme)